MRYFTIIVITFLFYVYIYNHFFGQMSPLITTFCLYGPSQNLCKLYDIDLEESDEQEQGTVI